MVYNHSVPKQLRQRMKEEAPLEHPTPEPAPQDRELKAKGRRALIINVIFFLILFGAMFLVPLSGIWVAAAVIVIAFIASMLYIYLF